MANPSSRKLEATAARGGSDETRPRHLDHRSAGHLDRSNHLSCNASERGTRGRTSWALGLTGQLQMNDIGRNHGVVTEPGMPKCNPWVSPECARLYPSLFKRVPQPRAEGR
jgi:hypothetical protein